MSSICAVWQRQQLPQHIAHAGCRRPGWHYHQRHMLREITSDFGFVLRAERAQAGGQTKARRLHRRHKAAASAKLVSVIRPATVYRTVGVTARPARAATSHSECIERNAESVSGYSVQFSGAESPQVRCLDVRGLWTLLRASLFSFIFGFESVLDADESKWTWTQRSSICSSGFFVCATAVDVISIIFRARLFPAEVKKGFLQGKRPK